MLRLVVELQTPPSADARGLQDAVQRLLQAHWLPLIEQACNSQGQPDLVQRIDQLTLDLGSLPTQALVAAGQGDTRAAGAALNAQFLQGFSTVLGQALQAASVVQADLELVAFFLHTGALPWWADGADRHAVQRAALALLQGPALDWRPLLGAPDAPNSGRLVAALHGGAGTAAALAADAALARLLDHHLQPGPGGAWPAAQQQAWWGLLAQAAVALGQPLPALRSAWWCAALASQLRQANPLPTSTASPALAVLAWLPQALQYTAAALGLPAHALPHTLHRLLQQAAPAGGTATAAVLPSVLPSVRQWLAGQAAAGVAAAATGAVLGGFKSQPAGGSAARLAPAALGSGSGSGSGSGLGLGLGSSAAGQTNTARSADAANQAAAAVAARHPTAPISPIAPAPQPAQHRQAGPPPALLADALQHGQADALYIANAGLVWLWPFLPKFFERLGLWQRQQHQRQPQWVAPGAAQRAALLLQYAASGDADPPEFQLLLNKLLCGLPLDAPLQGSGLAGETQQAPPSDDERAECEALLVATIAQAPILRAMSVAGFRSSFVLRGGQLSGRDGHPLLRVQRGSYDLVLDRFPWGVSTVRLPWMTSLLQVQW